MAKETASYSLSTKTIELINNAFNKYNEDNVKVSRSAFIEHVLKKALKEL